jgi:transcriptional regulator with XRE-family HTH domain
MNDFQNTDMAPFGAWLLNELRQRGMSQYELARISGVPRSRITYMITGKQHGSASMLTDLAHALNLPVDLVFVKAGILPVDPELSQIKRIFIDLVKRMPDQDAETLLSLVRLQPA